MEDCAPLRCIVLHKYCLALACIKRMLFYQPINTYSGQKQPDNFDDNFQLGKYFIVFNPSNAIRLLLSLAQKCKDFKKPSKPCHVGFCLIALAKNSQMSTHVPGFQSFFGFLHLTLNRPLISHQQHKG